MTISRIDIIAQNGNTGEHYKMPNDYKERMFLSDEDNNIDAVTGFYREDDGDQWTESEFTIRQYGETVSFSLYDLSSSSNFDEAKAEYRTKLERVRDVADRLIRALDGEVV